MKVQQKFRNVSSYASGVQQWCNNAYAESGLDLKYTFAQDFAIADWFGVKNVRETYARVKKEWLDDYRAFTEVAIALNLLAWANNQLKRQGIDGRDEFIMLYSEMYHEATDDFYERYREDENAKDYFFEMTD